MFFDWLLLAASLAIQFILIPKPQNAKAASLDDFDLPVCEEGKEFGVLSGTEMLKGPNVTWWGDLKTSAIKGARRYGFFGPRQVIGHKYYLGIQMTLCQGPADALREIWVGDKLLWRGVNTGGRINVKKDNLFGGTDREGGISGAIDVCMGEPTQAQNDYLAQDKVLGPECPAFRGVVTIVLRQVYVGTTPYIKPWAFKLQRIHKRSDNSLQWYDAKAAVPDSFDDENTETGYTMTNGVNMSYRWIETRGDWAAIAAESGIAYVWNLDDPSVVQSFNYIGAGSTSVIGGYCYITTDNEIVTRRGGNIWGGLPTYLDFRNLGDDLTNPSYSIPVHPYVDGVELNSGFFATEWQESGGTKWMFVIIYPYGIFTGPFLLLQKTPEATQWSVYDYSQPLLTVHGDAGAMGPDFVYLFADKGIGLIKWSDGSFNETQIDISADVGVYDILLADYYEANDEIILVGSHIPEGTKIFVYNSDGTILKRSAVIATGAFMGDNRSMYGRAMSGNIIFVPYRDNLGRILRWDLVNVNTLLVADSIPILGSDYVQAGSTNNVYLQINEDRGSAIVAPSAWVSTNQKLALWPLFPPVLDMNPAHIIREYLTDPQWAMGYNDADIDDTSFTYAADTFYSENFGLTIYWVKEELIDEMITIVLSHVDAVLYVSRRTGKFILVPIRDDYALEDLPIFDEDDVVEWSEVKRTQPADVVTSINVKYTERRKDISKDGSATFHNDAAIQQSDGIIQTSKDYPGISRNNLALRVAERDQHTFNPGNISGTLVGNRKWQSLNPGSPFRLTSSRHNLAGEVLRVLTMKFYAAQDNRIGVTFIQDMFRLGAAALVDLSENKWGRPGNNPLPVDPRLVWEMPYYEMVVMIGSGDATANLTADPNFGMLEVAGEKPTDDTIDVTVNVDGVDEDILSFFSPSGFLSADIGKFDTSLVINDATVFESIVLGSLAAIVETATGIIEVVRIDARASNTLTVSRGMLDTVPRIHLAGLPFIVFEDFTMSDFQAHTSGDDINVRLLSRTPLGTLSTGGAPLDTLTFNHRAIRPFRPANVTVEGQTEGPVDCTALTDITVDWSNRNRITETTPLAWTDADVTPEDGQTTVVEACDDAGTVLTAHTGLTGTTFELPVASFLGHGFGIVRVGSERDGFREWQAFEVEVLLDAETLALEDDTLYLDDQLLYIGE